MRTMRTMKYVLVTALLMATGFAASARATTDVVFSDDFNRADLGSSWQVVQGTVDIQDGALHMTNTDDYANAAYVGNTNVGDGSILLRWNYVADDYHWKGFYVNFRYDGGSDWWNWHRVFLRPDSNEMDACVERGYGDSVCWPVAWSTGYHDVLVSHQNDVASITVDGAFVGSATFSTSGPATEIMLTAADDGTGQVVDCVTYYAPGATIPPTCAIPKTGLTVVVGKTQSDQPRYGVNVAYDGAASATFNCGVNENWMNPAMDATMLGGSDLLPDQDFNGPAYVVPYACYAVGKEVAGGPVNPPRL